MKNILLIEDEENLNRGISLKLKKEGYAVFSAACVSEGLKLFQDNTIDLVICDIGLPDGSGLDLCKANGRQRCWVISDTNDFRTTGRFDPCRICSGKRKYIYSTI